MCKCENANSVKSAISRGVIDRSTVNSSQIAPQSTMPSSPSLVAFTAAINTFDVAKSEALLADPDVDVNGAPTPAGLFRNPPIGIAATSLVKAIKRAKPRNTPMADCDWLMSDASVPAHNARQALHIVYMFLCSERVDVNVSIRCHGSRITPLACRLLYDTIGTYVVSLHLLPVLYARADLNLSSDVGAPMHTEYRRRTPYIIYRMLVAVYCEDLAACATLLQNPTVQSDALDGLAVAMLKQDNSSHSCNVERAAMLLRTHPQYIDRHVHCVYYPPAGGPIYETSLIRAAEHSHVEAANVGALTTLLRLAADVTARNCDGYTALTVGTNATVVKMLLRVDAIDMHARPSVWLDEHDVGVWYDEWDNDDDESATDDDEDEEEHGVP